MTVPRPAGTVAGRPRPRVGQMLLAAAAVLLLSQASAGGEPYVPERDDVVLERLPAADDDRVREARRLAARLDPAGGDLEARLEVVRRYVDLGRSQGDPRFFGLAEGVLGSWMDVPDPPPEVLLERSTLRRARHDFEGALADLDALLEARPNDAQAHLDRAALLEALGDYAGAEQACMRVLRLYPSLTGIACVTSARSLAGRARPSYETLGAALRAAPDDPARSWALTIQGEIAARLGEAAAAERHFLDALALADGDVYLLASLADLLLDQGRAREVAERLEGEERADPLLLRRALALQALDDAGLERARRTLAARFEAARRRGATLHLRDEARFVLHLEADPEGALERARRNWQRQKGPADARILLEAALAAGDPAAALPVKAWISATRIEDVALERLVRSLEGLAS